MLRYDVNLGAIGTFSLRLTWVMTQRAGLEGASSHPRHPGDNDLFLKPSGLSLFVLIYLTLESLYLACPFSETDRIRLGYIVRSSTSCSVHEEEERRVVRTDGRFPTRPKQSNWNKHRLESLCRMSGLGGSESHTTRSNHFKLWCWRQGYSK